VTPGRETRSGCSRSRAGSMPRRSRYATARRAVSPADVGTVFKLFTGCQAVPSTLPAAYSSILDIWRQKANRSQGKTCLETVHVAIATIDQSPGWFKGCFPTRISPMAFNSCCMVFTPSCARQGCRALPHGQWPHPQQSLPEQSQRLCQNCCPACLEIRAVVKSSGHRPVS
jgi:hypothetical protein